MRARGAALGWPSVAAVAGALVIAAAIPFWFSSYWVTVGIDVCVFAILGVSYNLLLGRIGLFSLGHALLFGVAGYMVANLTARSGLSLLPAAVLGVVASAAVAAVTGLVAAGVRGIYFAMMTLAFAQVGFVLAETDAAGFSGGEDGLAVAGIPELININVRQDALYWLALGTLVLVLVVVAVIWTSSAGRLWNAVRENDVRAAALGIDVRRQRVVAYSVAGALAGVAGVLFALSVQTVTPSTMSVGITVQALLITVIGGTGTFWGPWWARCSCARRLRCSTSWPTPASCRTCPRRWSGRSPRRRSSWGSCTSSSSSSSQPASWVAPRRSGGASPASPRRSPAWLSPPSRW